MARGAHYPLTAVVGADLFGALSKDHLAALAVDLVRQMEGEDRDDEEVRAELVSRLDVLAANGLVPRTVPARFPRKLADV